MHPRAFIQHRLLTTVAIGVALGSCGPMDPQATTSTLPAPNRTTQYQFPPTPSGQPASVDLSQAPAALNSFMGTYSGRFKKKSGSNEEIPFELQLVRRQNPSADGVSAYATFTLRLKDAAGTTVLETREGYLGIDPQPYLGTTYLLATNSFESDRLSYSPISIRMLLAVHANTTQFNPAGSLVAIYDCGLSLGNVCTEISDDVEFKTISKTQ